MRRQWRRLDWPGLEIFEIVPADGGFTASSTIVGVGGEPFGMSCLWALGPEWRTRKLDLRLWGLAPRRLTVERVLHGWLVDGRKAGALGHCDEIDLSATPFCNSMALRQLRGPGELTALYIHVPSLKMSPSRQRYEILGKNRWRYIDLGVAKGFEADLRIDDDGLVVSYEGLFETVG